MSVAALPDVVPGLTFHEAIKSEIDSGCVDPSEILRRIRTRYTDEWWEREVQTVLLTLVRDEARLEVIDARQKAGRTRAQKFGAKKWLTAGVFVPSRGWVNHDDMRYDDVLEVVGAYDKRVAEMQRVRDQYERVAEAMKKQNAATVADIEGLDEVLYGE